MSSTVAIIDYGSGNLRSVARAFERAVSDGGFNLAPRVTDDPDQIATADRIVLPGVGAFKACMDGLQARPGVIEALRSRVLNDGRPFLGICVGMQLLADTGEEYGRHEGLGWVPGVVRRFSDVNGMRIPHMGWNTVALASPHPVFAGFSDAAFYFAHSYYFDAETVSDEKVVCDYGGPFAAGVGKDNTVGVQFHPEKSQAAGLALIANFLRWRP